MRLGWHVVLDRLSTIFRGARNATGGWNWWPLARRAAEARNESERRNAEALALALALALDGGR